jgi:hypothetical protein
MFTRIGRDHGEGNGEVKFFRKLGSSAVPSVASPSVCFSDCVFFFIFFQGFLRVLSTVKNTFEKDP